MSISYFFSLYSHHLILLVVGQDSRSPRFRRPYFRKMSSRKTQTEETKPEGMMSLDTSISLIDPGSVAEYEDSSNAFWNLYASEAKDNDYDLVDGLVSDADSMVIVVRISVSLILPCNSLLSPYRIPYSLPSSELFSSSHLRRSTLIMTS